MAFRMASRPQQTVVDPRASVALTATRAMLVATVAAVSAKWLARRSSVHRVLTVSRMAARRELTVEDPSASSGARSAQPVLQIPTV